MRERILKMTSKFFKRRRCRLCAETLPEFLCKTAQALRASASLQKAIAMAADDTTGPLGEEARMVSRLASSGVDMSSALKVLGERVPEREILIFVESTIALRAAGASMSEMIEKIAEISAARIEVRGRIDAQNAQNKYQAVILGAMPWLMLMALSLIHYDYVSPLLNFRSGRAILAAAFVLQLLGFLSLKKLFKEDD